MATNPSDDRISKQKEEWKKFRSELNPAKSQDTGSENSDQYNGTSNQREEWKKIRSELNRVKSQNKGSGSSDHSSPHAKRHSLGNLLLNALGGSGPGTPDCPRKRLKEIAQEAIENNQLPQRNFTFKQFCLRMTSHGLADFAEAESLVAKVWWLIMILVSVAVFIYYAKQSIYEYYTDPITTSINYVPMPNMNFPQLYICPMHFVNWTYVLEQGPGAAGEFELRIAVFQPHLGSVLDGRNIQNMANMAKQMEERHPENKANVENDAEESMQDYIMRVAYEESQFIKECQYHLQYVDCAEITMRYVDKEYGLCYMVDINLAKNIDTSQTTPGLGLSLILDLHTELYPTRIPQPMMDGAMLRFGKPVDFQSFSGSLVQPGTFNKLTIESKQVNLTTVTLAATPQKCIKDGEIPFKILALPYTLDTCRADCALSNILEVCNCIQITDMRHILPAVVNSTKFCTLTDLGSCVYKHIAKNGLVRSDCLQDCHRPCSFWDISVSASQAKFPADNIVETVIAMLERDLQNNSTLAMEYKLNPGNFTERLSKNIIALDIAFDQLEYIQILQRPSKTLTSLFGDIGGQAGLWTGASVFTVMQLFVFLIYLVYSSPRIQTIKKSFKASVRRKISGRKTYPSRPDGAGEPSIAENSMA